MNFSRLTESFFFGTNPGFKACGWVCNTKVVSRGCEAPTLNFPTPLLFPFSRHQDGRPVAAEHQTLEAWTGGALDGSWAGWVLTHSPNAYLLFSLATQNSINCHVWISGYNLWVRKVKLTRFIPNWLRKNKGCISRWILLASRWQLVCCQCW